MVKVLPSRITVLTTTALLLAFTFTAAKEVRGATPEGGSSAAGSVEESKHPVQNQRLTAHGLTLYSGQDQAKANTATFAVSNRDSRFAYVGKGVAAACSRIDPKLPLFASTLRGMNARCFERASVATPFAVEAGGESRIEFSVPELSKGSVYADQLALYMGDAESATHMTGATKLPAAGNSNTPLSFEPNKAAHDYSFGLIHKVFFGPMVLAPELGASFEPNEPVIGSLFISNSTNKPQNVVARYSLRHRNLFGEVVSNGEAEVPTIAPNAKLIQFNFEIAHQDLPPGSYLTSVQLFDQQTGAIASEIADIRFTQRGLSASIQNLSWTRNDDATIAVRFKLYGSADWGDRHRPGVGKLGVVKGDVVIRQVSDGTVIRVPFESPTEEIGPTGYIEGSEVEVTSASSIADEELEVAIELHDSKLLQFPPRIKVNAGFNDAAKAVIDRVRAQQDEAKLQTATLAEQATQRHTFQSHTFQTYLLIAAALAAILVVIGLVFRRRKKDASA